MRFYHVTPTRRVPSICKHGLHARHYGRYPVLLGPDPSARGLRLHLQFYRQNPCKRRSCSVVVFNIPRDKVERYVNFVKWYGTPTLPLPKGEEYRFYRALAKPLPPKYLRGFRRLKKARAPDLLKMRKLTPCPARPRLGREYVREGRLIQRSWFDGVERL